MKHSKDCAEIIRLAVMNLEEEGLRAGDVLKDSINWLYERYQVTGDIRYLRQSLNHIQVFLEQGNSYHDNSRTFDRILHALGMDKEELLLKINSNCPVIKANKSQIRSMIGRWNPGTHSMSIHEVIEDIIKNVKNGKDGVYYYYSGKILDGNNKYTHKDKYRLTVQGEQARFWDMRRNKYYTIKR